MRVITISGDISPIVGQALFAKLDGKKTLLNFDIFINKIFDIDKTLSQADRDSMITEIYNIRSKLIIDLMYTYIRINYSNYDYVIITNVSRIELVKQCKSKLNAFIVSAKSLPSALSGYITRTYTWMDQTDIWDYTLEEYEKSGLIVPDITNLYKEVIKIYDSTR